MTKGCRASYRNSWCVFPFQAGDTHSSHMCYTLLLHQSSQIPPSSCRFPIPEICSNSHTNGEDSSSLLACRSRPAAALCICILSSRAPRHGQTDLFTAPRASLPLPSSQPSCQLLTPSRRQLPPVSATGEPSPYTSLLHEALPDSSRPVSPPFELRPGTPFTQNCLLLLLTSSCLQSCPPFWIIQALF